MAPSLLLYTGSSLDAGIRRSSFKAGNFPGSRNCKFRLMEFAAAQDSVHIEQPKPMRKVVEHVSLLQMKQLTEEQEKDMLDNLYTLQYYFRGIVCVSLGRLMWENQEQCTHGLFMRFSSRELLLQFNEHPAHMKIIDEFVYPYSHGLIVVDYESEVVDDLEPIFRRGEDFESGIEHIVFLKVKQRASPQDVEDMLKSVNSLNSLLYPSLVQLTAGENFSRQNKGYTHAIVARLASEEALEAFNKHERYVSVFSEKVLPLCTQVLSTDYRVEPIGTSVMP